MVYCLKYCTKPQAQHKNLHVHLIFSLSRNTVPRKPEARISKALSALLFWGTLMAHDSSKGGVHFSAV